MSVVLKLRVSCLARDCFCLKFLSDVYSREIETEHERETQELQKCWTELRKLVRTLYGKREEELDEDETVPDDETAKELVTRLVLKCIWK